MSSDAGQDDLPKFRMWMRPDGIVQLVWATGAVMTLEAAQAAIQSLTELTDGRRAPLLVDAHDAGPQLRPARTEFVRRGDAVSAVALLVATPLSRIMGNFYLTVSKPISPTRLFEDETEALNWLRKFLT